MVHVMMLYTGLCFPNNSSNNIINVVMHQSVRTVRSFCVSAAAQRTLVRENICTVLCLLPLDAEQLHVLLLDGVELGPEPRLLPAERLQRGPQAGRRHPRHSAQVPAS